MLWMSMAARKLGPLQRSTPHTCTLSLLLLLLLSLIIPFLFWAARISNLKSSLGQLEFHDLSSITAGDQQTLKTLDQIEKLFPKEMIDAIFSAVDDSGPLSLNIIDRKDLSSSWVLEEPIGVSRGDRSIFKTYFFNESEKDAPFESHAASGLVTSEDQEPILVKDQVDAISKAGSMEVEWEEIAEILNGTAGVFNNTQMDRDSTGRVESRKMRLERKHKRLAMLTQEGPVATVDELEKEIAKRTKPIDAGIFGKYSIWRREFDANSDSLVRLMRDQLIMARVYTIIAQSHNDINLLQDLRFHIKESEQVLGEASIDTDLPHSAAEKVKSMGQLISKARQKYDDCQEVTKKLRAFLQSTENQSRILKKHGTFLSNLAAKAVPKEIHCISLQLTIEYSLLPEEKRNFPNKMKLEDPDLFHYALFSDNVLAASVVVNSTVLNAKEPEKHVLHIVTDKLNYGAMRMWFLANPPGNATIEVQNVDDFKWLNSSYCPVLRQLESSLMKEYYFKAGHPTTLSDGSSNLKYRNPKYLSMLNHLRFYLPEIYPKLDKILFLDDDIVVQKDLTLLWSVNLHGKVNGAVETCGESFHRFDKYLNFSNPLISKNFDPNACGWAYGMNIFDLREWKRKDITGIYHKWQNKNEDRLLWKLGTLPPGLITFYNLTHPLEKFWHVLGLGYNPSVDKDEIDGAAVIHYNGNMKPWLELSMSKYKPYWMKYVKHDSVFLKQCNGNV